MLEKNDYGAKYVSGFPFSFGIFQEYYSTHALFSKEPPGIAIIGTSAMVLLVAFKR